MDLLIASRWLMRKMPYSSSSSLADKSAQTGYTMSRHYKPAIRSSTEDIMSDRSTDHKNAAESDQKKTRRRARKATPAYLERAALWYLQRYASSCENLRRILKRKVDGSARDHDTDRDSGYAEIDALIKRFVGCGLLDDARFAEARARSLHERGMSPRTIRMRLIAKGITSAAADEAIASLEDEIGDLAAMAAYRYARRRRIGIFRDPAKRAAHRDRDLAALARNGFGFDLARAMVDADDEDDALDRMGLDTPP